MKQPTRRNVGGSTPTQAGSSLQILCIVIALTLGFAQVWFNRFYMTYDGVSYLDMADAYLRGDWHTAINGYWNPLYSWVIGAFFAMLRPTMYWEYPTVQLVNFLVFCATIAAFEYLLPALTRGLDDAGSIRIIGYGLFLWTSLDMIRVWMVNPDMIVAAVFYLVCGILLRPASRWTPVFLGTVLALGYYAKSAMLPISCLLLLAGMRTWARRQLFWASAVFIVLISPLIIALSHKEGHFSISETGSLNYAWEADHVQARMWEGGPDRAGLPAHPPRVVLDSPRVFEFGGVFPVTYAPWYDSSYWYKGLHVWWRPRSFTVNFLKNAGGLALLLVCQGGAFIAGLAIVLIRKGEALGRPSIWFVWTAAVGALILYCAVHCELRYLASFVCVAFLIPFAVANVHGRRLAACISIAGVLCAASLSRMRTYDGEECYPWQKTNVHNQWRIATELKKDHLNPGDSVSLANGEQAMANSRWARLTRVHIVAELDRGVDFWQLSAADQKKVLGVFAATGSTMALGDDSSESQPLPPGWIRVDATGLCEYPLQQRAAIFPPQIARKNSHLVPTSN